MIDIMNFLGKNGQKKKNIIGVVAFYSLFVFLANWSIILGTNFMKWDIWDAHYPMHVIVSDAIHSRSFPIWNPLFNFGTPYYAMVGTPVFYPLTLFFDIIGYRPNFPAIEYGLHLVIAALGMYLLSKEELKVSEEGDFFGKDNVICFIAGLIYAFSGLFFSNAEHIMIIISAAWIPYVLFFALKYERTRDIIFLFLAAMSLSMILLGGYPEMLFDTVLVLFPWIYVNSVSDNSFVGRLKLSIKTYIIIGGLTVCASAISLFPFIKIMPQITRGGGQKVFSLSFTGVFSLLFPKTAEILSGEEVSMQSFFISFFCLIVVGYMIAKGKDYSREKQMVIVAAVLMTLCFGTNSFIDMILYRFLPVYSTFRFPTVWRSFFFIFLILAMVRVSRELLFDKENESLSKVIEAILKVLVLLGVIVYIAMAFIDKEEIIANVHLICNSLLLLTLVVFLYYLFFRFKSSVSEKKKSIVLIGLIAFECLSVAHLYFPLTVAMAEQTDYYTNPDFKSVVDQENENYSNRNKNCEFSGNGRSSVALNSHEIAMNKTFDSEGYLSIRLTSIDNYKSTYNYSLIADNPEVYFTNSVDILDEKDLSTWLNDQNNDASAVAVTSNLDIESAKRKVFEPVTVKHFGFNFIRFNYDAKSDGIVTILQAYYPGWKLYVDGRSADIAKVDGCFMGVPLKKGGHDVVLKFRPVDFFVGLMLTGVFYVGFVVAFIIREKK